ncbi:2-aminoethylphosphonate--pyruvate transaminase, partial [Hansschlegelia beijingensis]
FVLARKSALEATRGAATTLALDLFDQHQALSSTGQYRFTPPIHVIAALHQALEEFRAEGGAAGRGRRYAENARILIEGMARLGFRTLLPEALQAPIIVTFRTPEDERFVFQRFYDALRERGFVIYPGKLTVADTFRVGCIGDLHAADMAAFVAAVKDVLLEMGAGLRDAA